MIYTLPTTPTFNSLEDFVACSNLLMEVMVVKIALDGSENGYESFAWFPAEQVIKTESLEICLYENPEDHQQRKHLHKPGFFVLKNDPAGKHLYVTSDDGLRTFQPLTFNYFGTMMSYEENDKD